MYYNAVPTVKINCVNNINYKPTKKKSGGAEIWWAAAKVRRSDDVDDCEAYLDDDDEEGCRIHTQGQVVALIVDDEDEEPEKMPKAQSK